MVEEDPVKDRVGQVWHSGNSRIWQIFVVVAAGQERNGFYDHMTLIMSSSMDRWLNKVAPHPEMIDEPWESISYFKRII
jgi:hypothetical protein